MFECIWWLVQGIRTSGISSRDQAEKVYNPSIVIFEYAHEIALINCYQICYEWSEFRCCIFFTVYTFSYKSLKSFWNSLLSESRIFCWYSIDEQQLQVVFSDDKRTAARIKTEKWRNKINNESVFGRMEVWISCGYPKTI